MTRSSSPQRSIDEGVWIDAGALEVGEMILSLDGDYGIVESVVVVDDADQRM